MKKTWIAVLGLIALTGCGTTGTGNTPQSNKTSTINPHGDTSRAVVQNFPASGVDGEPSDCGLGDSERQVEIKLGFPSETYHKGTNATDDILDYGTEQSVTCITAVVGTGMRCVDVQLYTDGNTTTLPQEYVSFLPSDAQLVSKSTDTTGIKETYKSQLLRKALQSLGDAVPNPDTFTIRYSYIPASQKTEINMDVVWELQD